MIPTQKNQNITGLVPNLTLPMPELNEMHPEEAAKWLFLDRFISISQLSKILGINPKKFDIDSAQKDLMHFMNGIFSTPQVSKLIKKGDTSRLQMLFSSSALLFRHNYLSNNNEDDQSCNIANLRERFPTYFYALRNSPNWYEKKSFYIHDKINPRWVLVELNFLNCTLINSKYAKYLYCKRKGFPMHAVKQKSVVEEIYDRIIIQESLGEELFDSNCSALTNTSYEKKPDTTFYVYVMQKKSKIGIHGSHKKPAFRKKRPYWPGFFPSVEFLT